MSNINEVPDHIAEVLNTLRELQRRLDVEMNSGLAASKGAGINPQHVRLAMQLSNASSQLSREARAWTKRVKELADTAPFEQKLEAVVRFLKELPEATRAEVLDDLR